jgi:hypothetical protein
MGCRERVVVLYNQPILSEAHPDYVSEVEVLDNVEAVRMVLVEADYEVMTLGVTSDPQVMITGLRELHPDAVVNTPFEAGVAAIFTSSVTRLPVVLSSDAEQPATNTSASTAIHFIDDLRRTR